MSNVSNFNGSGRKRKLQSSSSMRIEKSGRNESKGKEISLDEQILARESIFMINQMKVRTKTRLKYGNTSIIDDLSLLPLLFEELKAYQGKLNDEFPLASNGLLNLLSAVEVIKKLDKNIDFEVLLREINERKEGLSDKDKFSKDYWSCIDSLVDNKRKSTEKNRSGFGSEKVVESVHSEILEMIESKDKQELKQLINQVEENTEMVDLDPEYWETVMINAKNKLASSVLEELEEEVEKKRKTLLKKLNIEHEKVFRVVETLKQEGLDHKVNIKAEPELKFEKISNQVVDKEIEKLMTTKDEVKFKQEETLLKPKYFNKVRIGFIWSRYNQAHYDEDNPPPKSVQGYEFNIFYPQLTTQKTPTFRLEKDKSSTNDDTAIIRFIAGKPYQDLAFKVENKEWDKDFFHGFKSFFENGILQLHFNFKKLLYRK